MIRLQGYLSEWTNCHFEWAQPRQMQQNLQMDSKRKGTMYEPKQLRHQGKLSPIKPRQKMPTIYRHRRLFQSNLSEPPRWPQDNSFLKSKLDRDIQLERQSMLIKTGLTSPDNPEWMAINYDDYRRSNCKASPKHSYKQERFYDIFNNSKVVYEGRNEDSYFAKMQSLTIDRPRELDLPAMRKTLQVGQLLHGEVAGKVGAIEYRDFSIPRPQLKVGSKNFVDTYSPF